MPRGKRNKVQKSKLIKEMYTTKDLADLLGIDPKNIRYYAEKGKISCETGLNKKRTFTREAVIQFLSNENLLIEDTENTEDITNENRVEKINSGVIEKSNKVEEKSEELNNNNIENRGEKRENRVIEKSIRVEEKSPELASNNMEIGDIEERSKGKEALDKSQEKKVQGEISKKSKSTDEEKQGGNTLSSSKKENSGGIKFPNDTTTQGELNNNPPSPNKEVLKELKSKTPMDTNIDSKDKVTQEELSSTFSNLNKENSGGIESPSDTTPQGEGLSTNSSDTNFISKNEAQQGKLSNPLSSPTKENSGGTFSTNTKDLVITSLPTLTTLSSTPKKKQKKVIKEKEISNKRDVIYARVSKSEYANNLDNQVEMILEQIDDLQSPLVYKEIGSGYDDKRKYLRSLMEAVLEDKVNRVFITDKDRLSRLGYNYLEMVLELKNVPIVVVTANIHVRE